MEDLTLINGSDLKKDIFNLCQYIWPNDLQTEGMCQYHIFHALKVSKYTEETYTLKDISKDKPSDISNKFLLYKIKEELELLASKIEKEAEVEVAEEAGAEIIPIDAFEITEDIEAMDEVLKEASLIAMEENPDIYFDPNEIEEVEVEEIT